MARREQESQHEADGERDGGHDFEIDQRFETDPADFLQIAGAGDAVHHNAEHDRCDDHLDELEEGVAEDLERNREIRRRDAENNAENKRYQDLDEQRAVERSASAERRHGDCGSGHPALPIICLKIKQITCHGCC